jgi:outer membrane protein OmpA-like peptidoglycan-associated protein
MNLDPFKSPGTSKPKSQDEIFVKSKNGGAGRRMAPSEPNEPLEMSPPEAAPEPEKKKLGAVLRNPQWQAGKVGFNEEAEVSVDLELPEEHSHKTKVSFELFANTPKGPERISQGEGVAKDGKALGKIPVYIPTFKDEDGNPLQKVEYYFLAKHSEAEPLDGSKAPKLVDEMADRLVESHILPDITFATGSSFLRPNQASALKDLCTQIQEWQKKTPDGKLVVFGHADAIGAELANKALSERRAKSVLAFLLKDQDGMEILCSQEKWGLKASQELLKHLGHDPGAIDGQDGAKTQAATKAFQAKQDLAETGSMDSGTRKVLFKAFIANSNNLALAKRDFDDINGNPSAGCSEFNLADKTAGASEANRRVGVFLLKSNKNFPITYPCAQGSIGPCQKQVGRKGDRRTGGFGCAFYDKLIVERPNQKTASKGSVKRFLHSTEKELKQFINVSGGKNEGMEFHLEVEVEGNVDKVFWKVIAGKGNSKRNDPVPGWMEPSSKKSTALSGGIGEWESAVTDGKAKAVFCLGMAGGDEFVFEVGAEKGKKELDQKVINWRRLWYQLTHHKDITPPSMATSVKKLESVFIEFNKDATITHSKAPAGKVYVGSHNASEYHSMLATKTPRPMRQHNPLRPAV